MPYTLVLRNSMIGLLFSLTSTVTAQEDVNSAPGARNYINAYVGLIDLNVNYERNIIQKAKSFSNLRFGAGKAQLFVAGEGYYVSTAFVHLMGENNSRLEVDLGLKCMVTNSIDNPKFSDTVIPDIFLGYRYEKSSGGLIFRLGLSYPTIINLGLGYKF